MGLARRVMLPTNPPTFIYNEFVCVCCLYKVYTVHIVNPAWVLRIVVIFVIWYKSISTMRIISMQLE